MVVSLCAYSYDCRRFCSCVCVVVLLCVVGGVRPEGKIFPCCSHSTRFRFSPNSKNPKILNKIRDTVSKIMFNGAPRIESNSGGGIKVVTVNFSFGKISKNAPPRPGGFVEGGSMNTIVSFGRIRYWL